MKDGWKVAGVSILILLLGADVGLWVTDIFAPVSAQHIVQIQEAVHTEGGQTTKEGPDYIAVANLVVLAFQAWIFYRQSRIMKQQAVFMRHQNRISSRQADITHRQANTNDRIADILNRQTKVQQSLARLESPVIFPVPLFNMAAVLSNPTFDQLGGWVWPDMPRVDFWFKNYGKIPAVLRSISAKIDYGATEPSENTSYPFIDLPKEIVIGPERGTDPRQSCFITARMAKEEYQRLMRAETFFWWFGYVQYFDVLGAEYVTHFCWRCNCADRIFSPHSKERNYTERIQTRTKSPHSAPSAP